MIFITFQVFVTENVTFKSYICVCENLGSFKFTNQHTTPSFLNITRPRSYFCNTELRLKYCSSCIKKVQSLEFNIKWGISLMFRINIIFSLLNTWIIPFIRILMKYKNGNFLILMTLFYAIKTSLGYPNQPFKRQYNW